MAISPETLNDSLQELAPKYGNLFERWSPVINEVINGGTVERSRLRGPYKEFRVITKGPGQVQQIVHGGEHLGNLRADITAKGNTYAPRLIYSFVVPGKDMAEMTGPQGIEHLIKMYPEAGLTDFHQRIAKQMMVGNGEDVGGFLTFNGNSTYSPQGTARTGVFSFAAPAAQTSTVFGLAKEGAASGVTGWYNGYGNISSMSADGLKTIRREYYSASRKGMNLGPVDVMLADELTYLNLIENLDDRVITLDQAKDVKGFESQKEGIKFLGAKMYLEEFLDVSDATVVALNGIIYGLKSSTWGMYTLGEAGGLETAGDFSIRPGIRRPDMDAWQWEYVLNMGMYCNFLSANFVITGGNIQ